MSSFSAYVNSSNPDQNVLEWFALQVNGKVTRKIATVLEKKGYESFTPCYSIKKVWCDRTRTFEVPVWLGYVFVKMDARYRMPVLTTPGVYNVVGVGRQPVPISETEIRAVRDLTRSGLPLEPWPFLKRGDPVNIVEGPLRGLTGMLVDVRNSYRVVVSVQAIERSVAVHVNRESVVPIEAQPVAETVLKRSCASAGR